MSRAVFNLEVADQINERIIAEMARKRLTIQPVTFKEACAFIEEHHRHHIPSVGHRFSIAVNDGNPDGAKVVGVAVVGRPVARHLDDSWTLEVTRCCTDGTPHACSKLYAAAWRAARAMGYKRLITYTLKEEPGTSLRAAGWKMLYETKGGSWSCQSRPRIDKHPTGQKCLWEAGDKEVE